MTPSRKAFSAAAALVILAAALVPLLVATRPNRLPGLAPALDGAPQARLDQHPLLDGVTIEQSLPVIPDGLSEVDVYLNSWGHPHLAPIHIDVLDSATAGVMRSVVVSRQDPREEIAYFRFEPIPDSGRRHVAVRFTAPGAVDSTMVSMDAVMHPAPGVATLTVSGAPLDASMPLRTRFGAPIPVIAQAGAVVSRASQYHPEPFKGLVVALITLLALAAAAALPAVVMVSAKPAGD